MLMERQQRLDDISRTLGIIINGRVQSARQRMDAIPSMPVMLGNKMQTMRQMVLHMGQMLNSLSYKSVLSRGFAIVRDTNGIVISHAENAPRPASIEFADGVIKL